ncbi:hypothetical protein AVEN_245352-1 [Araneus ventricosus]|uniref:Uncharacterized protein n=1 Tax=Araneus ventricosus TaxID=182803 RepID=A0A4Y2LTM8_ARAVE|nr:hypothetical protein AVEN_245352-1 [Araneus ventricosus]
MLRKTFLDERLCSSDQEDFHTSTLKGLKTEAYPTLKRKRGIQEQSPKFSGESKPEKKENRSTLTCYEKRGKPGYIQRSQSVLAYVHPEEQFNSITLCT